MKNISPSATQLKQNLGKLRLFILGYTKEDRPNIMPLQPTITELFSLTSKDLSEAFSNQLQSMSKEQGDSTDCVNRQISLPDWSVTP